MEKLISAFEIAFLATMLVQVCDAGIGHSTPMFLNVRQFGAVGDGEALDTKAINRAIDSAASVGGGTVVLPAGKYLCGSIHLKSNICLYLDPGTTIIAGPVGEGDEYDEEEPSISVKYQDYGHSHWHNSLIWGSDLHDVSISGSGRIYGKGLFKDWVKGTRSANKSISLLRCRNVTIKDVTIVHGGWFAILATGVDNLTIDNLKIDTNRDGIDIDCCKDVHISNCSVNSPFDDGICPKSSFALGYARATENVTITNCIVSGYDEGSMLDGTFGRHAVDTLGPAHPTGRIKFGTESNGGFKNIVISNCVFEYCRGLALETVDGGLLEDVTITNITMRDIVTSPIFMRLGARMRGPDGVPVGELRRVSISNVVAYNVDPGQSVIIAGIPGHNIKDIELENIKVYYKGGGAREEGQREVPLAEKDYPEPTMFGVTPSYGMYVRFAESITLHDIHLRYLSPEYRPAIILDNVKGADIRFVRAQISDGTRSLLLRNTEDIDIFRSFNLETKHLAKTSRDGL